MNLQSETSEKGEHAHGMATEIAEPGGTKLIATTNPGLEDIVVAEFAHRLEAADLRPAIYQSEPEGISGRVLLESSEPFDAVWLVAQSMRSIHHVHRPVCYFELSPNNELQTIQEHLAQLEIDEMAVADTFRVTSKRSGNHGFTSLDVQKAAGAGIVDRYGCKVDLTSFDTNVRVDVNDNLCSVMVQLTHDPLDQRYAYAYRPRVALKTNMAFALLMLAGVKPDGVPLPAHLQSMESLSEPHLNRGNARDPIHLLDPFCGSGTILIESATCLPSAMIYGNERFDRPYVWTQDNLRALSLTGRVTLTQGDARNLADVYPTESMDVIVTNPPFGAQLGKETNFYNLYLKFLTAAADVIKPDGRIIMLVWKRTVFNKVVQRVGLKILHARVVDQGGIFPGVFVLKK